jgi:hypothetical protein
MQPVRHQPLPDAVDLQPLLDNGAVEPGHDDLSNEQLRVTN